MTDLRSEGSSVEMGPAEGESDIPWKPPVIAAILGALVVGIYVIYAIVVGPSAEEDVVAGPPSGYTAITETVQARVEQVTSAPTLTHIAVSTAPTAAGDPASVSPLEIAYWELSTPSGSVPMQGQYRWPALTGSGGELLSVTFPADAPLAEGELVAYPVRSVAGDVREFALPADLPQTIGDVRIDLGDDGVVIIESLTIGRDGGYVEWKLEQGIAARVDVTVTLLAAGASGRDETVLVPEFTDPVLPASNAPDVPSVPYAFGSQYRLVRSDASSEAVDAPSAIRIEVTVDAVTALADPVTLPLDR